jgi:hypothetical protein
LLCESENFEKELTEQENRKKEQRIKYTVNRTIHKMKRETKWMQEW